MIRLSSILLATSLLLVSSAPRAGDARKPSGVTLAQAVNGVQALYAEVTDFKADFRQVVRRKHLPRPLKKQGTVYFKKPGMMRWDYAQPDKVYYISDGEILWSYQPAESLVYKLRITDSELYSALKFLFGQGNLRDEFDIRLDPPRDGMVNLHLTPKAAQSGYKSLALLVDPATFHIRATELTDPLDNVSHVTFESPTFEPLKAEGFHFEPPDGVRIEDFSRRRTTVDGAP